MRSSKRIVILIVLLAVVAAGSFYVWAEERDRAKEQDVFADIERFSEVLQSVIDLYVEERGSEELIDAAIDGMLRELDPHSVYLDKHQYENLMIDTKGEFGGLGITIVVREEFPTVISPIEGTPAWRMGIQGGDRIVEIEGESTRGWTSEDAVEKLRGRPGTQVNIGVAREGLDENLDFAITREVIRVPSITYSQMLDDDIGYVRIARFAEHTARDLHGILRDFEDGGMDGLILDLRSNPGGLLNAARDVADLFLGKDQLIVYTESRIPSHNQKFYSHGKNTHSGYPVVVLVNGASASASEIVAGALQDWDKAVIVGQTTFGKGSVQTVIRIGEDSALKLTTQKYFTPSHRCIHKDRDENGEETETTDSADRKEYYTNSGRVVYGGGGITPDWEIDLPEFTDLQLRLERTNSFFSFAVHYTVDHEIREDFVVDDEVLAAYRAFLAEKEIEYDEEALSEPENLDYVKLAVKREIFRKEFGAKGAYIATLPEDEEIAGVLEMFRDAPTLEQMFVYVEEKQKLAKSEEQ